jgi:hypothetical protein
VVIGARDILKYGIFFRNHDNIDFLKIHPSGELNIYGYNHVGVCTTRTLFLDLTQKTGGI